MKDMRYSATSMTDSPAFFFIHKHATFIRADHLKKIWKDLFLNNKGRRQKSCSFGGAHHKIAYPPVVVKLPLFCGKFFA